jgi:YD repeat-containing protein
MNVVKAVIPTVAVGGALTSYMCDGFGRRII